MGSEWSEGVLGMPLFRGNKGREGQRWEGGAEEPEQVCKPVAGQPVAGHFGGEQRQPAETNQAEAP